MRAVVMTWVSGGNLPPLLAAASLLDRRGHEVTVLGSGETCEAARRLGLSVTGYRRSPAPDIRVDFEAQADRLLATMAGAEIALDARDALAELRPDLAVVDCMLPAAIAAARAVGTPTASLVHFLYGLARTQMLRTGGGWTSDLGSLAATHRMLGLAAPSDGLSAWEAPELLLVTAPRWLDIDCDPPANVLHAGPLGVRVRPPPPVAHGRQRVLLTFSSTVMAGQVALIERVCGAVVALDVDAVLTLGRAVGRDEVRVPAGVDVMAHADHDRLMSGSAAVISHGGLGTVLRALAHGVPQLLLPLGRDQAFNAGRVDQLEAGMPLAADAPPERIRVALRELLTDRAFEQRPLPPPGVSLPTSPTEPPARDSNERPVGPDCRLADRAGTGGQLAIAKREGELSRGVTPTRLLRTTTRFAGEIRRACAQNTRKSSNSGASHELTATASAQSGRRRKQASTRTRTPGPSRPTSPA